MLFGVILQADESLRIEKYQFICHVCIVELSLHVSFGKEYVDAIFSIVLYLSVYLFYMSV